MSNFEYPDDIPENLDKEILYASGDKSTPGERIRNFMTPIKNYFAMIEAESKFPNKSDEIKKMLESSKQNCVDMLPYIEYWLKKVE